MPLFWGKHELLLMWQFMLSEQPDDPGGDHSMMVTDTEIVEYPSS